LRLISIVEGELAAPWRRTCRLKPLIFALVETPLPVRKARPFPRQPYDWRPLLAAIGEGLEHITLVALLDYLDMYGFFRHWMTATRCLSSRFAVPASSRLHTEPRRLQGVPVARLLLLAPPRDGQVGCSQV
jgi:hypothetical protein